MTSTLAEPSCATANLGGAIIKAAEAATVVKQTRSALIIRLTGSEPNERLNRKDLVRTVGSVIEVRSRKQSATSRFPQ